jgi:diguanylate cyclase (GGDEF)-like protein
MIGRPHAGAHAARRRRRRGTAAHVQKLAASPSPRGARSQQIRPRGNPLTAPSQAAAQRRGFQPPPPRTHIPHLHHCNWHDCQREWPPVAAPIFDQAGSLRRAVASAYIALRERDQERLRGKIAADTLRLLGASAVRPYERVGDDAWRQGETIGAWIPELGARMEAELLSRALATGRSLLSSHAELDPTLRPLAAECAGEGITTEVFLIRSEEETLAAFGVHWLGQEWPGSDVRLGFHYYFDISGIAFAAVQERQRIEGELESLYKRAFRDPLTGLPNSQALEDELRRHSDTRPMAVLVLDFDGMREANSALGYSEGGDRLIRVVGEALGQLARPGEFPARLHTAGDEFGLLLPGISADAALRAAEIETALDELEVPESHRPFYRGASVGYAVRIQGETAGQMLGRATEAMRERKLARQRARRDAS